MWNQLVEFIKNNVTAKEIKTTKINKLKLEFVNRYQQTNGEQHNVYTIDVDAYILQESLLLTGHLECLWNKAEVGHHQLDFICQWTWPRKVIHLQDKSESESHYHLRNNISEATLLLIHLRKLEQTINCSQHNKRQLKIQKFNWAIYCVT